MVTQHTEVLATVEELTEQPPTEATETATTATERTRDIPTASTQELVRVCRLAAFWLAALLVAAAAVLNNDKRSDIIPV